MPRGILLWEEVQTIAGDPDFNRRDLWDSIESGSIRNGNSACSWCLPRSDEFAYSFDRFSLLDATKIIPRGDGSVRLVWAVMVPVRPATPSPEPKKFAHIPSWCRNRFRPNDPLLQFRNFSQSPDTQLIRLGGPGNPRSWR